MTTNQAPKGTVLTDEQILEIGVNHEAYSQSDRVIRFSPSQFVKCARALLSAQPASAPLKDEDAWKQCNGTIGLNGLCEKFGHKFFQVKDDSAIAAQDNSNKKEVKC